jgi:hypothetical protein
MTLRVEKNGGPPLCSFEGNAQSSIFLDLLGTALDTAQTRGQLRIVRKAQCQGTESVL